MMKKWVMFLCLAGMAMLGAEETWNWQNPLPQGNQLNDVFQIDALNAVAVGRGGIIVRTEDGGNGWTVVDGPPGDPEENAFAVSLKSHLNAVFFIDADNGWIVGNDNTILNTSDGGLTWQQQPCPDLIGDPDNIDPFDPSTFPVPVLYQLQSIFFITETNGWAVGRKSEMGLFPSEPKGGVLKTTDGGETWEDQESGIGQHLCDVFFLDNMNGWAVGGEWNDAVVVKSTDGGLTWQEQTSLPDFQGNELVDLRAVQFLDAQTGWIAGGSDLILYTGDGGASWNMADMSFTQYLTSPRDLYFQDANHGWIAGKYILYTENGGGSWTVQSQTPGGSIERFQGIHGTGTGNVMVVGPAGQMIRTANYGADWDTLHAGIGWDLESIFFLNQSRGWAVGDHAAYFITENGGTDWQFFRMGLDDGRLTDIVFFDDQTGWATGQEYSGPYLNGKVFKTETGDNGWQEKAEFQQKTPQALFFLDENTGWVVGEQGLIACTDDGGENWTEQDNPYSESSTQLESVFFVNENDGWAAGGYSGNVLHTNNGGDLWTEQVTGAEHAVRDVFFLDAMNGWAAGSSGTLLRTMDGGEIWTAVPLPENGTAPSFNKVVFADSLHGWIAGSNGVIMRTADGGLNWIVDETHCATDLQDLCFSGAGAGWAAGVDGTILAWQSNAVNSPPQLTSSTSVQAVKETLFSYTATATDPDDDTVSIGFESYPSWLEASGNVLSGTVPALAEDTSFVVVLSDGMYTERYSVTVDVIPETGINTGTDGIPEHFFLAPCYPNPFNSQTQISFGLPQGGYVTLNVYNIRGQKITTLIREQRPAGFHHVRWQTAGVPSGVYICRIEVGNPAGSGTSGFVTSQKMILEK